MDRSEKVKSESTDVLKLMFWAFSSKILNLFKNLFRVFSTFQLPKINSFTFLQTLTVPSHMEKEEEENNTSKCGKMF